jgi:gliding motility-associatede transport system auxiliary component
VGQRANLIFAVLVAGAVALAALGFAGFGEDTANSLLFAAWSLALLALFALALRLPLRGSGSRLSAWISTALITGAAIVIVVVANVALFRHDVHFDVSREGRNTPPSQLTTVIDNLHTPLALTYFYNAGDVNALNAKELIEIAAHGHPLLSFRAIDLDKEPGLARDAGVRAYNTVVLEAGDRKVLVENTTDLTRLAYATLRVLKQRVETVCFITGHGETFQPTQAHFHYSHVETLKGHDVPGAGDVLVAAPEQLDRLLLALTEIGYETRGIVIADGSAIPSNCSVVADIGPRGAFAPGEADTLVKYLAGGGRLLLLLDPVSQVSPELDKQLLGAIGLSTEPAIVIDPLNHSRTDPDKVAVPYYPPHPITARVALTVFPQTRPIHVTTPPAGVGTTILASSSQDSYRRPLTAAGVLAAADQGAPDAEDRGAQVLAVAVEGAWPGAAPGKPFRLVLAGTSKFATNEYFPFVSNGELSVAMVRWLASDEGTPGVAPQTYQLPEIVLTSRQMRDVFLTLEVLLPLSTMLCGVLVWWRRR